MLLLASLLSLSLLTLLLVFLNASLPTLQQFQQRNHGLFVFGSESLFSFSALHTTEPLFPTSPIPSSLPSASWTVQMPRSYNARSLMEDIKAVAALCGNKKWFVPLRVGHSAYWAQWSRQEREEVYNMVQSWKKCLPERLVRLRIFFFSSQPLFSPSPHPDFPPFRSRLQPG